MSDYVLDSSAILALLFLEPGSDRVEEILDGSVIGRINITEVLAKLVERGSSIEESVESLAELAVDVIEFDEGQSKKAAELRPVTRHLGLSLGDRACIALAMRENAIAVTADRNWADLDVCKVELIR